MSNRVVVACRANTRVEWDICYICQEAEHARYLAQEIKNEEKKLVVGYCDEEKFFGGGKFTMTVVKEGGTLPAPASSIKKFKEEPLDFKTIRATPAAPPKPMAPKDEPQKVVEKTQEKSAPAAKPTSELGMFRTKKAVG